MIQKKILHIFSSLELGGTQRRFLDLMSGAEKNHQHIVYAMDGNYDALSGITLDILDFGAFKKNMIFSGILKARSLLKKFRPDLVITYNWGATEWALAARTLPSLSYYCVQDGFGPEEQKKQLTRRRWLRKLAMKGAKKVVVPSLTLVKIARQSWQLKPTALCYIPNGIALERFDTAPNIKAIEGLGLTVCQKIITVIAALRPEKNIARLIQSVKHVSAHHAEIKLLIIGDGAERAMLTNLAANLGLKDSVIFTGHHQNPEFLLPASTIFALSSDTEQMPLSVAEAMAAGLPVASTDVGDIKIMVDRLNRPQIAGNDAETLTKSLLFLLDNPKKAKLIGDENQKKARRDFTKDKMIAAWNAIFNESA